MGNILMISVIMPVYNVENYLDKAVESVLGQTYGNLELILVDDRSPDNCSRKCDEWAARDIRVKVIHKPVNEGLGLARNTGMQLAQGHYIMFMDSDDWIEDGMLEGMLKAATAHNSDIVICGYSQDYADKAGNVNYSVRVSIPELKADGRQAVLKAAIEIDYAKLFSFAWNKLYSANLIKRNGCLFTKTKLIEDFLFNIVVFGYTERITVISEIFYHYIKPLHSTLLSAFCENYQEIIDLRFVKAQEILAEAGVYKGRTRSMLCFIYVKHIFARLERDCWPESKMRLIERYEAVTKMLLLEPVKEAVCFSKSYSTSGLLMNFVLKTKNAFIITVGAKLLWLVKNKLPRLFNVIKQH